MSSVQEACHVFDENLRIGVTDLVLDDFLRFCSPASSASEEQVSILVLHLALSFRAFRFGVKFK